MSVRGGMQPYRKDAQTRLPGPVLDAMLSGRDLHGSLNAADYRRAAAKLMPRGGARKRPKRAPRPRRAPRL